MARQRLALHLEEERHQHTAYCDSEQCERFPGTCSCPGTDDPGGAAGGRTYTDSTISNCVSERLRGFYRDGTFTDVTLKAENVSIKAHKLILAAASGFFQAQFSFEQYAGADVMDEIELVCDGSVLKNIIDYIYFGQITISRSNVVSLMDIQNYLQVASLRNLIDSYVRSQILDSANCFLDALKLKKVAERFRYQDLSSELFLHIRKKFSLLLQLPEFLEAPLELLLECLQSDYLVVGDQDRFLLGMVKWVSFDYSRITALDKLLSFVDTSLVKRWNETKLEALDLFESFPDLREWLDTWFSERELTRFPSRRDGRSRYKTVRKSNVEVRLMKTGDKGT